MIARYFCVVSCLIAGMTGAADDLSGDLIVFHAGSLSVPIKEMAAAFTREHPGMRVLAEAAGSLECARKIADLGKPCDVMVSADYAVIDTLLIPKFADWNIKFAGNEMAIVHTRASKYANEINSGNWHEILLREDVAFGRADPNSDPCGYRAVLTMKLAEDFYKRPGLADALMRKDLRYIRPKETDLLALLETKTIDYLFLYRSVAAQHGLQWLALPNEINLKDSTLADHYKTVSVVITSRKPGTTMHQRGEPIAYGITIPKNAPNPSAARAFVEFLLEKDKGLAIMEKNGQPPIVPALSDTFSQIPECLRKYALKP